MKIVDNDSQMTLVGTPDEFAEFIGFPDYDTLKDLRAALRHLAANVDIEVVTKRAPWSITGSWESFAELIGGEDLFTTKEAMLEGLRHLHPEVTVVR